RGRDQAARLLERAREEAAVLLDKAKDEASPRLAGARRRAERAAAAMRDEKPPRQRPWLVGAVATGLAVGAVVTAGIRRRRMDGAIQQADSVQPGGQPAAGQDRDRPRTAEPPSTGEQPGVAEPLGMTERPGEPPRTEWAGPTQQGNRSATLHRGDATTA